MKQTNKQLINEIAELHRKIEAFQKASFNRPAKIQENMESEEQFYLLVEHANEAMLVIQNGKIRYVNSKAAEITGYSKKALSSKSFDDLIHRDDLKMIAIDKIHSHLGKAARRNVTCRIVNGRGKTKWVDARLLLTTWAANIATICFLIDITERKMDENALRNSEMRYRQLVEHAPAGIYEIDLTNGKFMGVNDVMCEYTGYTKEEFLNLNFADLLTEESLMRNLERWDKIRQGEAVPVIAEYEIIGKNQRKLWILVNTKIKYEYDKPVSVTVIAHDITNRKQLEQELGKAQKLESLGILAGGIGHDFNNLLSGIMGNISLAKLEAHRGEDIKDSLDEALRVASKASALTQQLLVFSKGGTPVRKAASIADLLKESTAFTLRGSKVRCEYNIAKNLWPVKVDIGQFSQVIHNLVINAKQAMPKGGEIKLRTDNITLGEVSDLPLMPGRYVEIMIQDQGHGIAPEHLPKIFDPYFTTKSKGSGLGLTMSYTIIKRHDGHVTVESEIGKGTTFRIYLPATEEFPEAAADIKDRAARGEGRILIMDDEEILRNVAERMLVELGYEVACVTDGAEAIDLYERTRGSANAFDAVLMDLTIPGGMGGKEAIKKLLKIDPKAIAIVSSGYSNDPIMSNYKKFGFCGVVAKPYKIEELSWTIRDVLKSKNQFGGTST